MQVVSCPVMNICMCFKATMSLLTVRPIFMPLNGVVFLGKLMSNLHHCLLEKICLNVENISYLQWQNPVRE